MSRRGDVSFAAIAAANRSRCRRWHPGFPDDDTWSGADWSNATCGEAGEVASVIEELRRIECSGPPGLDGSRGAELKVDLAVELADVFLYDTLLAAKYRVDLPRSVVSELDERLGRGSGPVPEALRLLDVAAALATAGSRTRPDRGTYWTAGDAGTALFARTGEAANVVKKLRRLETGISGAPGLPVSDGEVLLGQLARLLAGVVIETVAIAQLYDLDLPQALVDKFNRVSERQAFPERLELERPELLDAR